ncbi:Uncharacterised protein [Candidatus Burarchaeum australiense]|nr:Uncharacterised protein [Candidatus Burarchaeum australiense]
MNWKTIAILAFLLLLPTASASIDVQLPTSACSGQSDILAVLNNLPGCIAESIFTMIASGLIYSSQQFLNSALSFISASPDPNWFCGPYNNVMAILETLYSLALMGVGLYYVVQASDVEGRIKAKTWLKDVFFMIVVLTFSFYIFDALLSLNHYLTASFLSESTKDIFNTNISFASIIFALVILLGVLFAAMLTFMTLLIRYLLIPFLLLMFPIAIFLYFMPFSKAWGRAFLKAIVIIVFMSTVDALFLYGLATLLNVGDSNLAEPFVRAMAIVLGFALVGLLNIALFLMAIMAVVNQTFDSLGSLKWLALPALFKML